MSDKIDPRIFLQKSCYFADIAGSDQYPEIHGRISFFGTCSGTVVAAEVCGLPAEHGVFAMHIHNGSECSGNGDDPFADAGTHLAFKYSEHPFHSGDLPALFSNDGYAWSAVYTNCFKPCQVEGYPVIIHAMSDDYHTQPSGNAGGKIACGIIKKR